MKRLLFCVSIALSCTMLDAQTYFPEVGAASVHQRTLDLKSNLNVLSVSLQPGFEDLASLAYFRMGRGAEVMGVYATNGEAGESDLRGEYPPQLAALRREEAGKALRLLDAEAYFLNLPDVPAARSMKEVRELWESDTVQYRLMKVISQFRPELIIIPRDPESEGPSLRWKALVEDVVRSVERLRFGTTEAPPKELPPFARWTVSRVIADDGGGQGTTLPTAIEHRVWRKTYDAIGREAAEQYESLKIQRGQWSKTKRTAYQVMFPKGRETQRTPDEGLPEAVPAELQAAEQLIVKLVRSATQLPSAQASARPKQVLKTLADALDAVDVRLAYASERPSRERKILLGWKEGLENLRLTLLGVTVRFTMPHTTVTDLQLTHLAIDTVTGLSESGKTEIYFPAVGRGLILDEKLEDRLPLRLHENYRLLFQKANPFNSPHWMFGLEENSLGRSLYFFIIHKAQNREENFVYRTIVPMAYAPRFLPEILTPLVRVMPGERLAFRIVNNSRDGVRDTFHANDSTVVSTRSQFRLNEKGAIHQDTLTLHWMGEIPEGTHIFPLKVGEERVASYVARSFPVEVDSSKSIGFLGGVESSSTRHALRRLGVSVTDLTVGGLDDSKLTGLDVIVVDRRAMSVYADLAAKRETLQRFAEAGGHAVVFAQDADAWNSAPLIPGIILKRSLSYSAFSPFILDSLHATSLLPNNLTVEDWSDWLYRQAFNTVTLEAGKAFGILFQDETTNNPLIVTHKVGKGQLTYIDLDLHHQLLNIHPGAFRLLANVLAR